MDDIRQNILREQEARKARLSKHFMKAFSHRNEDDADEDTEKAKETPAEQAKVEKVMKEFKDDKLHSGSKKGKKVKNRKQAIAIALSEAGINKAQNNVGTPKVGDIEKGGNRIWNGSEYVDSFDFLFNSDELEKAHQIGDVHPNGKWVWVKLPNGKEDWRTVGGRAHQRHNNTSASSGSKSQSAPSTPKQDDKSTEAKSASQSKTSSSKIDTETIDQAAYDKAYREAKTVKDTKDISAHGAISFGLSTRNSFIKETKEKLEETIKNRPGAKKTISELQKKLTMFVSQKKALEKALKELGTKKDDDKDNKKTPSSNKDKFKSQVIDDFKYFTDKSKLGDISEYITEVKKKGGSHYLTVNHFDMSPYQQREFFRVMDSLETKKGYRVESNGGLGTAIIETKSPSADNKKTSKTQNDSDKNTTTAAASSDTDTKNSSKKRGITKEAFKKNALNDLNSVTNKNVLDISKYIDRAEIKNGYRRVIINYNKMSDAEKAEYNRIKPEIRKKGYQTKYKSSTGQVLISEPEDDIAAIVKDITGDAPDDIWVREWKSNWENYKNKTDASLDKEKQKVESALKKHKSKLLSIPSVEIPLQMKLQMIDYLKKKKNS